MCVHAFDRFVLVDEYLHDYQIKVVEVGGLEACMGEKLNAYKLLVGRPEGRRCTWMIQA
jgi:hypothetical protein